MHADDWLPQGIEGLEPRAWEALRETGRSVCVTAGAGAGKTELLAQKAAYLIQTGICPAPRRVLAISFKRDAAATLAARVRLRLPDGQARRFVSLTFDAWTKGLLDQFRLALPDTYVPPADYRLDFPSRDALDAQLIRIASNLNPQQLERLVATTSLPLAGQGLEPGRQATLHAFWRDQYERKGGALLTFPMINRLVECILRQHAGIRSALRSTFPFVFLDEFQDTTSAQFDLVRTAFDPLTTRITTVGDDKQRIMGWAGAMPDGFSTFTDAFGARAVTLLANWRSHADLVEVQRLVAARIDPNNEPAEARKARTVDGHVSAIWMFEDRGSESRALAAWLAAETTSGAVRPEDVILLVRQHADRVEALIRPDLEACGVSLRNLARNVGGVAIQDTLTEDLTTFVLPFLRLGASERAPEAWSSALERMMALWAVQDADENLGRRVMDKTEALIRLLRDHMRRTPTLSANAEDLVALVLGSVGEETLRQHTPAYQRGGDYERVRTGLVALLGEGLQGGGDWSEALDRFEGKGQVPMMTIHKSKGMEFHTVIFYGLDSGWWSLTPERKEELNSFFVALTRAEQRAFFTFCAERGRRIGWLENLLGPLVVKLEGGPG